MDFDGCAPSNQPSVSKHPIARSAKHSKSKSQKLSEKSPVLSPNVKVCYPNANKVKLQQSSTRLPIHVFELQILSSDGVNVAIGMNATQSSTLWNFTASNAVDGDSTTFSHTHTDDMNAWLEVDLGGKYSIGSVMIKNRWCENPNDSSDCFCRLSGATLSLVDDVGQEVTALLIGNTCGQSTLEYTFNPTQEICSEVVGIHVVPLYIPLTLCFSERDER